MDVVELSTLRANAEALQTQQKSMLLDQCFKRQILGKTDMVGSDMMTEIY